MPRMPSPLARSLPYLLLFAATIAVGAELARPFQSASIAFDSQSAVLYFERITSGRHLEAFIPTTPKPLMTAIFGSLYAIGHDWRWLAWTTLAVNGLAISLTAALVQRIGGALAATFVGIALLGNANLLFDVGYALATPYALLGWAIAGLAVTAARPRYVVAGLGLAFATLARVETLVVIALVILVLGWATFGPRRWRPDPPPAGAWLVPVVGLLALPVMLLHDLALTGNPLHWASVASEYAARTTAHIPTPIEVARTLVNRYWQMGTLSLLAVLGVARILGERRHALVIGLVGLGPGIAAFLVLLAARGIFVPERYSAPIDVAVDVAAGLGVATISVTTLHWAPLERLAATLRARSGAAGAVAATALVAALVTGPYWGISPELRTAVRSSLNLAIHADRAVPALLAGLSNGDAAPPDGVAVLGPGPIRPRLAVDLGLDVTAVGGTAAARVDVAAGYPARGQLVFHDRAAEATAPGWADLEIDRPRTVGSTVLEPLLADPTAGLWVIAVR